MTYYYGQTMTLLNISQKWLPGLLRCKAKGVAYENCDALAIPFVSNRGHVERRQQRVYNSFILRGPIHSGSRFVTRKMHLIVASWLGLDSYERVGGYLRDAERGISHMNYNISRYDMRKVQARLYCSNAILRSGCFGLNFIRPRMNKIAFLNCLCQIQ